MAKNVGALIFGILLLIAGIALSVYRTGPIPELYAYPYQTVGIILIVVGVIFAG